MNQGCQIKSGLREGVGSKTWIGNITNEPLHVKLLIKPVLVNTPLQIIDVFGHLFCYMRSQRLELGSYFVSL